MDALSRLNELLPQQARSELLRCCGSSRWASTMTERRPFSDGEALLRAADEVWRGLDAGDWFEAFAAHPKIGDHAALSARFAPTRQWAEGEQAGIKAAPPDVLAALADANRAYEERFGYIFIVCATGKSAEEMLGLLRERLLHDPQDEIWIAGREQARITRLRLEKLLSS
jgi:2-oxo-4-hydroxy-4-carboxy-5-ureidoimidazoline decarboxylase